jgi:hypothetical protein
MVGTATYTKDKFRMKQPTRVEKNGKCIITGADYIQQIVPTASQGVQTGGILYTLDMDPFCWPGTNAQLEAARWQMMRLKRLKIFWEAACATTQVGQLGMAVLNDPTLQFANLGDINIRQLRNTPGSQLFKPWENMCLDFKATDRTWYYTQPTADEHEFIPAKWILMVIASVGSGAPTLGTVSIEYEIQFKNETINNISTIPASVGTNLQGNWTLQAQNTIFSIPTANFVTAPSSALVYKVFIGTQLTTGGVPLTFLLPSANNQTIQANAGLTFYAKYDALVPNWKFYWTFPSQDPNAAQSEPVINGASVGAAAAAGNLGFYPLYYSMQD